MILNFHLLFGVIALIAGAWNLISSKGTRRHRFVGWVYVGSMTLLVLSSFGIFKIFSGFGPFHIMAIVSGITVTLAIYFPLRREHYKDWIEHHYFWIAYSYVGLIMATGSHLFQYGPSGWPFWARALLYWGVPLAVGSALIFGRQKKTLGRIQERYSSKDGV